MLLLKNFAPRLYQENILKTALEKNTLVVLPTGSGKTAISAMLAINRLNKFPNSKILLCSPTKPLCQQHIQTFKEITTLNQDEIVLLTGQTKPTEREKIWKNSSVIIATPQTIQSDLYNNRISLENFSLLIIDEAHRSRMRYANTIVAKHYFQQATSPRILALTASPGSTKEKINEICENLFIETVELRTEQDSDVIPYIQEKKIQLIEVELPEIFKKIHNLIKTTYKTKLKDLKKLGFTKPLTLITKRDLLGLQKQFQREIKNKNLTAFYGISLTAQLLKLNYALELLETQSLISLKKFLEKLQQEQTKAAKAIVKQKNVIQAFNLTLSLVEKNIKHPKMLKLTQLVEQQFTQNPNSHMIIFANFRNTVREIISTLQKVPKAKPIELMGQKEGITQKQQIQTIKDFENGIYNCLITTSIGEEGLDIKEVPVAIFYDHVSTSIRRIQRLGRVGRLKPGKIIFLLTKDTRDMAYYWKSQREEKKMNTILKEMRKQNE